MALQIAERAVVGEDVEPVSRPLEGAPRAVTAVAALADVGLQHRGSLRGCHAARRGQQLIVRQIGHGIERRRDDLDLAVGIEVGERHLLARLRLHARERAPRRPSASRLAWTRDTRSSVRRGRADRRESETPGRACAAPRASGRRTGGPRRADARASAAAAPRRPGRCRRSRRSTGSPPAACLAACRAPSRGWPLDGPLRNPAARAGSARRNASASRRSATRRSRTPHPSSTHSARAARPSTSAGTW